MKNIIIGVSAVIGSFVAALIGSLVGNGMFMKLLMDDGEARKDFMCSLSQIDNLSEKMEYYHEEDRELVVDRLIRIFLAEIDRIDAEKFYNSPLYEKVIMEVLESLILEDNRFDKDHVIEQMKLIKETERNYSKVRNLFRDLNNTI